MNIKTVLSSFLTLIVLGVISFFTLFAFAKSHRIKTSNSINYSSGDENAVTTIPNLRQSSIIQATNLNPTNGPINSIVRISIHGIGFSLFPKLFVHFDVTEGPYEVVPVSTISDTLLEVDTPSSLSHGDSGKSVLVSVYSHPDIMLQSSNALIFRFYEAPVFTLISPSHAGMSGRSEIKIFGTGLFASDDLKCLFQSKERSKIVDATYSMSKFDTSAINNFHENYNKNTLESTLLTQLNKNLSEAEIKTIFSNIQNHSPMPSIICESPSWTVSETVSLSISFNGVQYHLCTDGFIFEEESSLFGNFAHVVKERDTPEMVSENEIELKNPQYKTNNKIISSEIVLRNFNSKSNSHYISNNHQINELHKYVDNSGNTYTLSNSSNASLLHGDYGLFLEIVILFYSSFIFGTVCKFIGLPLLLGYIIGGYVVGPSGFGYISQPIQIISISQIGVCLILFTLGLEFSVKRVFSIGKSVIYCAVSSILVFVCLCSAYSIWIGTPINEGIFIGSFISMSSTAVVICELQIESNESMLTIGILILQDLLLGIVLALIPALQTNLIENVSSKASNASTLSNDFNQIKFYQISVFLIHFFLFLWKIVKPFIILMIFILISFIVKIIIFPVILFVLTKTKSREIILIGIVSIVLCISSLTEYLGLSMEMGSFVGGVILSSLFGEEDTHNFKHDFIQSTESLKWVFSMLFFTSIGLVIDATFIWDNYWTIGYVCLFISIIKFFVNFLIFFTFGHMIKLSAFTSLMLANLGEFGFVLASKGISLGIISRKVYLILVATTVISLLSTPIILRIFFIILQKRTLSIPLNESNYKKFNVRNSEITSIKQKFNFSKGSSFYNMNKRRVLNITNIIKNLSIFNGNSHSLDSSAKDYKFDIFIQNNYLNSRFQENRISHSNIFENTRTNPNFDFSQNENELKDLSHNKVAGESKSGNETSSISLEKIDEFTLAHVTNLGNSFSKM
ncbi:K+ H+ antiporter of bacterial origin [Cryptosporidium sp. chipmunk genotype I]|uniref:K+ H+ antiporter of bacterial origin n=1 Tax=Cryptosporidium sp. chipmunk genotype I TaxID=1280935 RepID=UPI00351A0ACC|nr:K+ H+ antiporter of bacterial origin [Cryptosporidium sp. chipmunk genotype I]